ncbi:MAG: prolipoprotein diacylglyceryl transferase [Gemmataceae bacterium]|nr:prolipoprotein diacylglyceryl transferase [Gemmataceae bacterium]
MYQILFTLPLQKLPVVGGWFPPDGYPVPAFGVMLFCAAVLGTAWATRRGAKAGMPGPRVQDMVIVIFLGGLFGARLLYMIQYHHQFPDKSIPGLLLAFVQIWKGGIIFYGSVVGGVVAYLVFYRVVIRRLQPRVSAWQLADAVAPILALGLALGRIGCYLNGCCWGQAAVPEACPVPLGGAHFPLLPALGRDQLVKDQRLQTSAGFTVVPPARGGDPRAVVGAVEPGSAAEAAGLKPGDKVVGVNGRPNGAVVEVLGGAEERARAVAALTAEGGREEPGGSDRASKVAFDDWLKAGDGAAAARVAAPGVTLIQSDTLADAVRDWPRSRHDLALKVARDGNEVDVTFEPRTVPLYPTQLYETVSMLLLIPLLLAFYPFRRHDGQLMTVCMAVYAVHRFVNESLRVEPAVGLGLTLSQWGSVVILAAAVGIELYLRRVMPNRWAAAPAAP